MTALSVDVLSWLLALLPIAILLVLLAVLRWQAPQAGPVGLANFIGILGAYMRRTLPWTLGVAATTCIRRSRRRAG